MSWRIFEPAAAGYEAWYATPRGRLADAAERRLLLHLLGQLPRARSAVEIGCGTGHFAAFLAQQGVGTLGLDRAPAMLTEARRLFPSLPVVVGDAAQLPFRDRCVDLTVFVTTLEFVDEPSAALAEAVRVACRGVIVITLNRHSLGGLSRRWGPQSRGALLSQARDYSARGLLAVLRRAAGARLEGAWSASTLFPGALNQVISRLSFGDVIGAAISLTPQLAAGAEAAAITPAGQPGRNGT